MTDDVRLIVPGDQPLDLTQATSMAPETLHYQGGPQVPNVDALADKIVNGTKAIVQELTNATQKVLTAMETNNNEKFSLIAEAHNNAVIKLNRLEDAFVALVNFVVLAKAGDPSEAETQLMLNTIFGFLNEYRQERSAEQAVAAGADSAAPAGNDTSHHQG